MASHSHSCSGETIDAAPGARGPRIAMCLAHLIGGLALGLIGMLALGFAGLLG